MNLFLDTEFTSLSADGELISIALVDERGVYFYAELTDYDPAKINPWLEENVMRQRTLQNEMEGYFDAGDGRWLARGDRALIKRALKTYFNQYNEVHVWADNHAYDWVFFCSLFGTAFDIPKNIHYLVFDIATLLLVRGIDPDISREELAGEFEVAVGAPIGHKHHALWDAWVSKVIYQKLIK